MLVAVVASAAASPAATLAAADARQADAASSKTWLLSNASDLRVGPPPGAAETQAELDALQALADGRDGAALDRISYWDAGAPPYRWTQRAIKYAQSHGVGGNRAVRLVALMNAAINDAVVASADSQQTFHRARPTLANHVVGAPATPGYPDERAAAAGAAERVLAYVFPSDTELFSSWADEAAFSRVEAGVAFPSDATAGRGLGRQVGELAVSWGQNDGSAEKWTGTVPTEPDPAVDPPAPIVELVCACTIMALLARKVPANAA